MKKLFIASALAALAALPAAGEDLFVDRAAELGIDFVHWNGMTGELWFAEMMGQGAALFDYDGDGDLDVYLVQGARLGEGEPVFPPRHPEPLSDRLYRNDLEIAPDGTRTLRFTDVTEESGIAKLALGYGMGVAAGDYDGDGRVDLYLTNLGPNQMLRNRGDGEFEDTTAETGTGDPLWGVPALFFDYDRDGRLDLFVGNYVDWRLATHKPCTSFAGAVDYCSPASFNPEPDRLFRNLGPAPAGEPHAGRVRFEDVTARSKIGTEYGAALGAVTSDFDGDGWPDLYVANDGLPNQLWLNRRPSPEGESGGVTFENGALLGGCAVNEDGEPEASMGVVAGDFDGDGSDDLFMTHLDRETNTFYTNDGTGLFEDRTTESGLGAPSFPYTGFGVALLDYDLDGWPDLFVANGAVTLIEEQARTGSKLPLAQRNQLFRGLGGGRFEEVTGSAGAVFDLLEVSRGAAAGDVDNDGDPDVLLANNAGPARLLIRQGEPAAPWIGLRVVTPIEGADGAVRDALGARVELHRKDARMLHRRVRTDGSYASAGDPRVVFGLGDGGAEIEKVVVRWPDGPVEAPGAVEEFPAPPFGEYTRLVRGTGKPVATRPAGEPDEGPAP